MTLIELYLIYLFSLVGVNNNDNNDYFSNYINCMIVQNFDKAKILVLIRQTTIKR